MIMKKILLAAVAALAIVGCSQNEEIEKAGEKAEINFGTVVSKTTRAAETNLATLQGEGIGFTVYAYNSGTEDMSAVTAASGLTSFMSVVKVTYNASNKWEATGGPYYWPLTDKIQFFAYGNPSTDALVYNVPTGSQIYPTITYTVADVAKQTDFVVAKETNKTKTNSASGVSLAFTHALAQVNFSVKGADKYTYKVTSITLKGIANAGTYDFGTNEWGTPTGTATYLYSLKDENSVTGTEAYAIGADNSALMLMPQKMPTEEKKATIEVVYQVFDSANVDAKAITEVITSTIDLKGSTDWETGKKIRYILKLANTGATVDFVVPEVGAWGTTPDKDLDTPTK